MMRSTSALIPTSAVALLCAAVAMALPGRVHAAPPSAAPALKFESGVGDGCPDDSLTASTRPDGSIKLTFPAGMRLSATASASAMCIATFTTAMPAGWTFAVVRVRYSAAVRLMGKTEASVVTNLVATGGPGRLVATKLTDAVGSISFANEYASEDLLFMPCGKQHFLNVFTRIGLTEVAPVPNKLAVHSAIITPADLAWREC